ncbi:restriction endonuclease subunit S [Tolypothrix sp. VBCCA 56010]|uniref:restriction endonuclease subunit S n=1 Tax=Tolypothrix sp. VBCCA 56010 TaxID=3137731 RepID=UPI003D7E17FA
MKRYPVYKKEDRLPGVKEIPEHWRVIRNSFLFKEVSETCYSHLELLSILSDKGVVKQSETGRKERAPEDRSSYKRILKGDIGYNLMNAFMGSIGVSNYEGIISPAYAVCRPKLKIDANYFHYLFRTNLYLTEFDRNAYGIMYERNRLYFDNFKRIYVPLPPLSEQNTIACFIDRKLVQIDQFIRNKQRFIELLKEQKSAIINRAVTKGLNPDAPMKPSGIEWLGDIPAHWEISKISYVCTSIRDGTHNPPPAALGNHRLLSVRNIINGQFVFRDDDRTMIAEDFFSLQKSYTVRINDIVLAIVGATTGKSAIVGNLENVTVQRSLAILRPNQLKIKSDFLNFCIQSSCIQTQIKIIMDKYAAQPGIYLTDVAALKLAVPNLEEQQSLCEYLKTKNSEINQAITKAEKEIELIQEYRTTLISDAVTGKIDVRELTHNS